VHFGAVASGAGWGDNNAIVLADVSFIHPLAASYICSAVRTLGHAAALRDAEKRRDYFADHDCPGFAFRAISFETLGWCSPEAMQFLYEATHTAFPQPGHQRAVCFANLHLQLSVLQCRYLSRMLTAAAGLHTARTGSGCIWGAPLPSPEIPFSFFYILQDMRVQQRALFV
jgi:hypothetical protein